MTDSYKNKWLPYGAAVASGVLTGVAFANILFLLAWVSYVPMFFYLFNQPAKQRVKLGLLFSVGFSLVLFFWMIPAAEKFTGRSMWYGVAAMLATTLFFCGYWAAVMWLFGLLQLKRTSRFSVLLNAVSAASLWVVAESTLSVIATGLPWVNYVSGSGIASNLYAVQPAAVAGSLALSFAVVFVNYLVAYFLFNRQLIRLWIPAVAVVGYLLIGFVMLFLFQQKTTPLKSFTVSILAANTPADTHWNEANGNALAQNFLSLNQLAAQSGSNMVLWSESAIPWTYEPNDDLLNEAIKITAAANMTHVVGINSAYNKDIVYNSVYALGPQGKMLGRYDKRYLLNLIERPWHGALIPFFSSDGFSVQEAKYTQPLVTPNGKAGVMICNEATVPSGAASMVQSGAQFILNLSNDGWFSDSYIVNQHFYNVRLRAVETRKDIAINSNTGFCGLVQASGEIVLKRMEESSFVDNVVVQPNNYKTGSVAMPYLLLVICSVYCIAMAVLKLRQ